jgi:hypothetical protein
LDKISRKDHSTFNNKEEYELVIFRTEFELERLDIESRLSKARNTLTQYSTTSQMTLSFTMSIILVSLIAVNLGIINESIYLILIFVPSLFAIDFYVEIKGYICLKKLKA